LTEFVSATRARQGSSPQPHMFSITHQSKATIDRSSILSSHGSEHRAPATGNLVFDLNKPLGSARFRSPKFSTAVLSTQSNLHGSPRVATESHGRESPIPIDITKSQNLHPEEVASWRTPRLRAPTPRVEPSAVFDPNHGYADRARPRDAEIHGRRV
jgi:hypothetical protein